MNNNFELVDEEIIEKFEQIDWNKLSVEEGKNFGLSVNYYKDALDYSLQIKNTNKERLLDASFFVVTMFLVAITQVNLFFLLMLAYMLAKLCGGLAISIISNLTLKDQRKSFHEDINELVEKYGNEIEYPVSEKLVPYVKKCDTY